MAKSTPDDLVVAFRSLDRRRREAVEASDGAPIGVLLGELDRHVAAAAALVGAAPDAAAVAGVIAGRPPKQWDVPTLDALRDHATAAGTVIRRITEAAPGADGA